MTHKAQIRRGERGREAAAASNGAKREMWAWVMAAGEAAFTRLGWTAWTPPMANYRPGGRTEPHRRRASVCRRFRPPGRTPSGILSTKAGGCAPVAFRHWRTRKRPRPRAGRTWPLCNAKSAPAAFPARDYVRGLPDWFHSHLLTMDAAPAGCFKATRHGGLATHARSVNATRRAQKSCRSVIKSRRIR